MAGERDPDDYRDGALIDDVPGAHWARVRGLHLASPRREQTEAEADVELAALRRRAERLSDELRQLDPGDPPPTIPDAEVEALRGHVRLLEQRIAKLRIPSAENGWLGHQPAGGEPLRCAACRVRMVVARDRCPGPSPGRY